MNRFKTIAYPLLAFIVAAALQVGWYYGFDKHATSADGWAMAAPASWWGAYLEGGWYWLAYTYGLTAAFTVMMLQRFIAARRENGSGALEGGVAVGGVTLTGAVAASACFLLGCCGSPMLAVWVSVCGATWLPYEKPFIAAVTTVMLGLTWFFMMRKKGCACGDTPSC